MGWRVPLVFRSLVHTKPHSHDACARSRRGLAEVTPRSRRGHCLLARPLTIILMEAGVLFTRQHLDPPVTPSPTHAWRHSGDSAGSSTIQGPCNFP